ncbi:Na+-driven multidrug efflux pump [Cohaesibacter sp. ES.047]|uniref:MATE family efflux transporter n=1 Tax=Cohaesibacter sp. ES.047 TaxID=1798205 RepID=UPI000BB7F88E|nr:MATE family efflux transporter [Cohaesibacter sp. ES.047]SNY92606.1 Na+-driven multidrug efflux pump [Cohaesibacter sp. ES.047]
MTNASPPQDLFDRGTPSILRLAGYLSLSGLLATSAILIDANMVAPVGDETLAGLGLCAGLYGVFMALLFGMGSAAQILLTRAFGAGDTALFYSRLFRILALGLACSLVLVLLFRFNINFLVDHLATTSGVGFAAKRYLELMVYGLPISFAAYLLSLSFDVRRQAKRELKGYIIELPINVILNALLIYGWFGAPELGVKGAAVATLVSQSARLCYLIGLTVIDFRQQDVGRTSIDPQSERTILVPVTLNVASLIVGSQAYNLLFSQLPYLSFAALALMVPWLSVSNVLGRAVALSATISCADLPSGSRKLDNTIGAILKALKILAPRLALIFVGVTLVVGGVSWHISSAVRINFMLLIPFAGCMVIIRTISVTIGAILRATGWPRWVTRVQVGLQWGVGLPLLLVLTLSFDLSIYVAFSVLLLEETIRAGIMWRKLSRTTDTRISE